MFISAPSSTRRRAEPDARANGPERPWLILNVRQERLRVLRKRKTMRCRSTAIFSIGVEALALKKKFAAWALSEESSARENLPSDTDAANERSSREKKLDPR